MSEGPVNTGPGDATRREPSRRSRLRLFAWVLPIAIVVAGLAVVTGMRWRDAHGASARDAAAAQAAQDGKPVPPAVMAALTHIPRSTWSAVGAAGARPPEAVPPTDAGHTATPQVFYLGAEFCPYCAAQRWPLIVALARFGEFKGLSLSTSSARDVYPSTPTFTFHGSSYSSPYLKLEAVETRSNIPEGNNYRILERPTPAQDALFSKYDTPPFVSKSDEGAIPFLLVGQRYLWVGASYTAGDLQGMTWRSIAATLAKGQGKVGRAIVANANMITAAICQLNGGRPANVCDNAGVRAAARRLPAAASN